MIIRNLESYNRLRDYCWTTSNTTEAAVQSDGSMLDTALLVPRAIERSSCPSGVAAAFDSRGRGIARGHCGSIKRLKSVGAVVAMALNTSLPSGAVILNT